MVLYKLFRNMSFPTKLSNETFEMSWLFYEPRSHNCNACDTKRLRLQAELLTILCENVTTQNRRVAPTTQKLYKASANTANLGATNLDFTERLRLRTSMSKS